MLRYVTRIWDQHLRDHPAQAYLPRFEFLLDDLSGVGEDQLLDRELTPAALITLLLLLKTASGNPRIPASCGRGPDSCGRCWTGPAAARRSSRS
jgi:hypothetical protein